jgi:hypothetical protein
MLEDNYKAKAAHPPNFHEKAHFVKADVAAPEIVARRSAPSPSRYASIRTLFVGQLSGDPVHHKIRLLGLSTWRCNLRIGLSSSKEGGPSSHGVLALC